MSPALFKLTVSIMLLGLESLRAYGGATLPYHRDKLNGYKNTRFDVGRFDDAISDVLDELGV